MPTTDPKKDRSTSTTTSETAPWFPVPNKKFICIEHPAIIKHPDKAVASIGGEKALTRLVDKNGETELELRLRPGDPFHIPIHSRTVPSSNLLLKITVPKYRRRKCRLDAPEAEQRSTPERQDAGGTQGSTLLDRMKSTNGEFAVEVVGSIENTVRFRDMADFQYTTVNSPFAKKFKDTILGCELEKIKEFSVEPNTPPNVNDILPPPVFSNTQIPHTYNYRQNPALKKAVIDGQQVLLNLQAAPKTLTTMVHISTPVIPSGPPAGLPSLSALDETTRACIQSLRDAFSKRPIWTRRALMNYVPSRYHPLVRFSIVHIAYMWRAGPWRDTCVVYGVNPTLSPEFRKYQCLFFQVEVDGRKEKKKSPMSHIFDGTTLIRDGRVFQLCDVTDPTLKGLIDRDKVRATCHPRDGWYRSGTMMKIKRIMRRKISAIIDGRTCTEEEIKRILELDSDEDEEGNQNPKIPGVHLGKKLKPVAEKREGEQEDAAEEASASVKDLHEEMDEDDEEEEAEREGEWEAEVGGSGGGMLQSEWRTQTVDKRVDHFMTELLRHGKEGSLGLGPSLGAVADEGEEPAPMDEEFDILEGEDSDDE